MAQNTVLGAGCWVRGAAKLDLAAIDALKTRAIAQGTSVKKSELLRAGLMLLVKADEAAFKAAIAAVPSLKTGRPVAEKTQAVKAAIAACSSIFKLDVFLA